MDKHSYAGDGSFEPMTREKLKEACDKTFGKIGHWEPYTHIISPEWYQGIQTGELACPCHGDFRHKIDEVKKP